MEKLQTSQILVPEAKLSAQKLENTSDVRKFIEDTRQKQAEVLKLKEGDQNRLKEVVQL